MSIEYYTCNNCQKNFPDFNCTSCQMCDAIFCCQACADFKPLIGEDGEYIEDCDDLICCLCRDEVATDEDVLEAVLNYYGIDHERALAIWEEQKALKILDEDDGEKCIYCGEEYTTQSGEQCSTCGSEEFVPLTKTIEKNEVKCADCSELLMCPTHMGEALNKMYGKTII